MATREGLVIFVVPFFDTPQLPIERSVYTLESSNKDFAVVLFEIAANLAKLLKCDTCEVLNLAPSFVAKSFATRTVDRFTSGILPILPEGHNPIELGVTERLRLLASDDNSVG